MLQAILSAIPICDHNRNANKECVLKGLFTLCRPLVYLLFFGSLDVWSVCIFFGGFISRKVQLSSVYITDKKLPCMDSRDDSTGRTNHLEIN